MITPIIVPMTVAATEQAIPVSVAVDSVFISVHLDAAYSMEEADEYEGPYTVTPMLADQTLETNRKVMLDDVKVFQIPIARTSNPYGGDTVLIG